MLQLVLLAIGVGVVVAALWVVARNYGQQAQQSTEHARAAPFERPVQAAEFESVVVETSRTTPVLVAFVAAGCAACRALTPVLSRRVQELQGRVLLATVQSEAVDALRVNYGIRAQPTVLLFQRGKVAGQFAGTVTAAELGAFLEAFGVR